MEQIKLEDQIIKDFEEYSKYVNEERAIPNIYDGQKPVARRILYTMRKSKLTFDKPTVKAATVVGRTMAYHPHGDSSIYGVLVRMAQPFSMNVPLVFGQGNFGSEEMPAAAARYTEVKLSKFGEAMTQKLNKGIVPMIANYDGTEEEPEILYAPVPILLNTGVLGIGVGMATSVPSHNLNEIIDATIATIENPKITTEDLLNHLKGPDFSSGCSVVNQEDFLNIYKKGKGSFVLRSIFEYSGNILTIKNLPPYSIAAKIETQIYHHKSEGLFRDIIQITNTTAQNQQLTIQLKKNFNSEQLTKDLCHYTDAERTLHLDFKAIDKNIPRQFTLLQFFQTWLKTHKELVKKEKEIDLIELQNKLEILEGLQKALIHIDELITIIKASTNKSVAKTNIIKIGFTANQAEAILNLKLSRLTKLEAVELDEQINTITNDINNLTTLLKSSSAFNEFLISQLQSYKGLDQPRRSLISNEKFPKIVKIKQEMFYLTFDKDIVRVTEDIPRVKHLMGTPESPIFILTENYIVPIKNSKEPIFTKVHAILENKDVFHFSTDGYVKRTTYENIKSSRKAKVTSQTVVHTVLQGEGYALITTTSGKQVQFDLSDVPSTKRGAKGVIAVKLGGEKIQNIQLIKSLKEGVTTGRNKLIK